ncbi:MAG: type II toxin-antitoxin system HicB family antitoxin [Trebonia sp.]
MSALHFESYTEARTHMKEMLDAAERGQSASVRRGTLTAMVIDADRLQRFLLSAYPSRAQVVQEAGGWSVVIPDLPVAADGATFDEAITEMIDALREYAEDWEERLYSVPNHSDNWPLAHLVQFSDDAQLRDWLIESAL